MSICRAIVLEILKLLIYGFGCTRLIAYEIFNVKHSGGSTCCIANSPSSCLCGVAVTVKVFVCKTAIIFCLRVRVSLEYNIWLDYNIFFLNCFTQCVLNYVLYFIYNYLQYNSVYNYLQLIITWVVC